MIYVLTFWHLSEENRFLFESGSSQGFSPHVVSGSVLATIIRDKSIPVSDISVKLLYDDVQLKVLHIHTFI